MTRRIGVGWCWRLWQDALTLRYSEEAIGSLETRTEDEAEQTEQSGYKNVGWTRCEKVTSVKEGTSTQKQKGMSGLPVSSCMVSLSEDHHY